MSIYAMKNFNNFMLSRHFLSWIWISWFIVWEILEFYFYKPGAFLPYEVNNTLNIHTTSLWLMWNQIREWMEVNNWKNWLDSINIQIHTVQYEKGIRGAEHFMYPFKHIHFIWLNVNSLRVVLSLFVVFNSVWN